MDITKSCYETYIGEYIHDDYQKDSYYHNVYIKDSLGREIILRYPDYGNHYHLRDDGNNLPIGTFVGKIVYSKNSKIVVDWEIDEIVMQD